jgi:hypothetical protein
VNEVGLPDILQFGRQASKLSWMSEFHELLDHIEGQCRRALASPRSGARREVEDLLTEGYLAALTAESRSRRISERLEALAQQLDDEQAAIEARRLAREKRTVDQRVKVLRARLQELRGASGAGRLQPS